MPRLGDHRESRRGHGCGPETELCAGYSLLRMFSHRLRESVHRLSLDATLLQGDPSEWKNLPLTKIWDVLPSCGGVGSYSGGPPAAEII